MLKSSIKLSYLLYLLIYLMALVLASKIIAVALVLKTLVSNPFLPHNRYPPTSLSLTASSLENNYARYM